MIFCVNNEANAGFDFDPEELARTVILKTLEDEARFAVSSDMYVVSASDEGLYPELKINMLIADDEKIRAINKEYRQTDSKTDVLSFPALYFEEPGVIDMKNNDMLTLTDPEDLSLWLGDIVMNADDVRRQALEYGHGEKREFAFLTAHSVLHLLGFDHESEEEARVMEKKQENILNELGIRRA